MTHVHVCILVVKKAMELHKKLEYVNEHQQCELKQCQGQLEQCRRELLEARVKVNSDRDGVLQSRGEKKCNSQELRIVCIQLCYVYRTFFLHKIDVNS